MILTVFQVSTSSLVLPPVLESRPFVPHEISSILHKAKVLSMLRYVGV